MFIEDDDLSGTRQRFQTLQESDFSEDRESEEHKELWGRTPGCDGQVVPASGGGVKCTKCRGWFCY